MRKQNPTKDREETEQRRPDSFLAKRVGFFLLGAALTGPALCLYLIRRSRERIAKPKASERVTAERRESIELPVRSVPATTEVAPSGGVPGDVDGSAQTPAPAPSPPAKTKPAPRYIASTLRDRFHVPTCRWAKQIADENLITFESREEAIEKGYLPCASCAP